MAWRLGQEPWFDCRFKFSIFVLYIVSLFSLSACFVLGVMPFLVCLCRRLACYLRRCLEKTPDSDFTFSGDPGRMGLQGERGYMGLPGVPGPRGNLRRSKCVVASLARLK